MDMESNPLFDLHPADAGSDSSSSSSVKNASPAVAPPPAAVLQTVNIKSHIPVELDIVESNYIEWRCFLNAFIGKFALEFRSLVQGNMDIMTYTGHIKQLADALRDVGQPLRETSQVLNMLRGLSPKYRHTVPVITTKNRPHTFLMACSYMLLEEQYDREHAKAAQHYALLANGAVCSPASPSPAGDGGFHSVPKPTPTVPGTAPRPDRGYKKKGRGRGFGPPSGSSPSFASHPPSAARTPGLNLWTGMVQAWPMPFRITGDGVLGPHPGA
ncbi:unnamed protein product [Miscanthus lutarioriparius]|uniref:Uncharacterized protein n=1 Tax=Miscanthus lutarioriparius TaxID=422564 RepID=A0A811Q7K1_9POAL|nr:unnamed protein product [Miscanthus lutarioriparius]